MAAPIATSIEIPAPQGVKRSREEDDDEAPVKDARMEEDEDEGGSEMEMSDDE